MRNKTQKPATSPLQGSTTPRAGSADKAKAVFKNFSLSKFPAGAQPPANYISKKQDVVGTQTALIKEKLGSFIDTGPGMTVTASDPNKLNLNKGQVDLTELLTLIQQTMHGTEFYATGNTIIDQVNIQDQVDKIINDIKGATKNA